MNRDTYEAIESMQLLAGQLGSLLAIVARSLEAHEQDAVDACASIAENVAKGLDAVPGFLDAQRGRYIDAGSKS